MCRCRRARAPAGGLSLGYSGQDFGPSVQLVRNELIRLQTGKKANFRNALDAVSVGGQIVCRSAAAVAAGCVPINTLGKANV